MHAPDFLQAEDPFVLFAKWFEEAKAQEPRDAEAAQIATVDADGMPNVRTLLVKNPGPEGFVFYTNFESDKGIELLNTHKVALLYYWKSLSRQVRLRGLVESVLPEEADAYFASRPQDSQLGAWASLQSQPMSSRAAFEKRFQEAGERFANAIVPRPSHWSGFRLIPSYIEFWQERPHRLHDRLAFTREGGDWQRTQLYP